MKVKILGNGVWGRAMFSVVEQNCSTVSFLKREEKSSDQDTIILSVPTQSIRDCLQYISFSGENKIIVNTAKGIEKNTHLFPWQIVHEVLGNDIEYYTLIGPSFADEVVKKMPTLVNLGYKKEGKNINKIQELFQTDFFKVKLTKGVEILEFSAAFKNIYAIVCGLADGLGYGTNTRIKLIILAIEEMSNWYKNLHLSIDSDMTAGTLGDLILTCNSIESRNFSFGAFLTQYSVEESLCKVNSTVEGFDSLPSIEYFKAQAKVELPLATFISDVVRQNDPQTVRKSFTDFIVSI